MTWLITRPEPQGSDFARKVMARGHEAVVAPLFTIRFFPGPALDGEIASRRATVLLASANGARALAARLTGRDVRILAVGPQTAAAARAEGFSAVEVAGGTSRALLAALPDFVPPGTKLLQATAANGRHYAHPKYSIDRLELYESVAAETLPEAAAGPLRTGALEGAFFFSPHSAEVFRDRVIAANLAGTCAVLTALCLSAAVAGALAPLAFASVRIAAAPHRAAMLDLLSP